MENVMENEMDSTILGLYKVNRIMDYIPIVWQLTLSSLTATQSTG